MSRNHCHTSCQCLSKDFFKGHHRALKQPAFTNSIFFSCLESIFEEEIAIVAKLAVPGYFQWHYFQNHPNSTWIIILFFNPKYWKDKQESFILFIASETKSNVLHFLKSRHLLSLSLFHKANIFHFLVTVFLVISFKHVSHNLFPIFSQHYNYYCLIILALPHPLLFESNVFIYLFIY